MAYAYETPLIDTLSTHSMKDKILHNGPHTPWSPERYNTHGDRKTQSQSKKSTRPPPLGDPEYLLAGELIQLEEGRGPT